jgi:hypothetical protein
MVRYGLPASLLAHTDEAEDPQLSGELNFDDIVEDNDNIARTAPIDVVQRPAAEATHQTPPAPRHVRVRRNPALASGSAADLLTQAQAAVAAWAGPGRATAPKRSLPLDISTVTIPQPAARAARRHPPPRFPFQTSCPHRHQFSPPEAAPTAQQHDSPHPATPPPGVKGHRCTHEVPPHSHRLQELTRVVVQHADTGHVSTHIFTEALHSGSSLPPPHSNLRPQAITPRPPPFPDILYSNNEEPSPTTSRQRHSTSNAQTRPSPGMTVSGTTPDAYVPPVTPQHAYDNTAPLAPSAPTGRKSPQSRRKRPAALKQTHSQNLSPPDQDPSLDTSAAFQATAAAAGSPPVMRPSPLGDAEANTAEHSLPGYYIPTGSQNFSRDSPKIPIASEASC